MEKELYLTDMVKIDEFSNRFETKIKELNNLEVEEFSNGYAIKLNSDKLFYWEEVKPKIDKLLSDLTREFGHFEYFINNYAIIERDFELRMFFTFSENIQTSKLVKTIMESWQDVRAFYIDDFEFVGQVIYAVKKVKETIEDENIGEYTPYVKWCEMFMQSEGFGKIKDADKSNEEA